VVWSLLLTAGSEGPTLISLHSRRDVSPANNYTSFLIGYSADLRVFTAAVLGGIAATRPANRRQ
jgi:hypothetical protein